MTRWEYKVLEMDVEWTGVMVVTPEVGEPFRQACNELGQQGWELVSLVTLQAHHGRSHHLVAAFKRPGGS